VTNGPAHSAESAASHLFSKFGLIWHRRMTPSDHRSGLSGPSHRHRPLLPSTRVLTGRTSRTHRRTTLIGGHPCRRQNGRHLVGDLRAIREHRDTKLRRTASPASIASRIFLSTSVQRADASARTQIPQRTRCVRRTCRKTQPSDVNHHQSLRPRRWQREMPSGSPQPSKQVGPFGTPLPAHRASWL
jgi:hypothetical protein